MKKCLLIDSTFACIPIMEALLREYEVFTVGNNTSALFAVENSKNHIFTDYSKIAVVKKIINKNMIEVSLPGCTDISLEVYGKLNPEFGTAISRVATKESFQAFCAKIGLKTPRSYLLHEKHPFPVIVKPDDSFSGKGITVVDSEHQMGDAVQNAIENSATGNYVIQEYLLGQLYSVSCFKRSNGSIQKFLVEEHCNQHAFSVDESFLVQQVPKWGPDLDQIIRNIYLGLPKKIIFLHLQFIVTKKGIYPIEMMLRSPGDLYSLLIQYSTGIDYGALYAASFGLNTSPESQTIDRKSNKIKRLTLKALPGEIVPEVILPTNTKDFHRTLPIGHLNTSALPVRYAVIFLKCCKLIHDAKDLNLHLKK